MGTRTPGRKSSPAGRAGAPPKPRKARANDAAFQALTAQTLERKARADAEVERYRVELGKLAAAAKAVRRGDDWQNALTGLGVAGRDWRRGTTLESEAPLDRVSIDDIYGQDNLAAKIVDSIPEHATRRWFRLTGGEGQDASKFQTEIFAHLQRLGAKQKFARWMKLARKDGGVAMLIGADDGARSLDKALVPERIREIRHLHNLERWTMIPDTIDADPRSPSYGEPLTYQLLPRANLGGAGQASLVSAKQRTLLDGARIHRSRLFINTGIQVSERARLAQRGWGLSVLQRAWGPIENYRVLWGHIATLFKHVSQTVIKLSGYTELQGAAFADAINARLAQIQMARSTLNVVPIDIEDELEEQTLAGLSGALEVFKYAQEDLAQAADMPLTQLFGHTPQGFAADDTAGMRNFYDGVRLRQEDDLLNPLTELVGMLATTYKITPPEHWAVDFLPLEEPSDVDVADKRNKDAMTSQLYITTGVLAPEEVRETLRADPKNSYVIGPGPSKNDPVVHPELAQPPDPGTKPPSSTLSKNGSQAPKSKPAE